VPQVRRALMDILAGAVFIVIGLAFATGSLAYDIGSPLRMGPGYYPLLLGAILVGLGLLVIGRGVLTGEGERIGEVDWRAVALITAALLFFGLTIRGLGVVGALFGSSLLAALGRSATSIRDALIIAVGLTALSIAIFIGALRLRLELFGSWLPL
jgi:Tripartite tricarboxylate transporter TctB family